MPKLILLLLVAPFAGAVEPDWSDYAAVLESHVRPGSAGGVTLNLVDYQAVAEDRRFGRAVATVRRFDVAALASDQEQLAFYINAYNILTVQLIIDHWPVASIRDIGSIFRGPWDIPMLGDLTLDEIEHEIIRSYGEPRIHFAVNCASISCPDLRTEPYTAGQLDHQLEDQTRRFLANPGKGLGWENGTARVSRIFRWYDEDFEEPAGVLGFVQRYTDKPIGQVRANLPYDWRLNGTSPP